MKLALIAIALGLSGCATANSGMAGLTPAECRLDFVGELVPLDRANMNLSVGQDLEVFFTVRPEPVVVARAEADQEVGLIAAGEHLQKIESCTAAGGHYVAQVVSLEPLRVRVRERA